MSDPIENAIKKTATDSLNSLKASGMNKVVSTAKEAVPPQAAAAAAQAKAAAEKLKNLPIQKDPELLKKQVEAEVLKKKALAQQLLLTAKDVAIEKAKQKLLQMALKAIGFPPKLPVINPKIIQGALLALQIKQMWKQRKSMSKENLKKGKEAYKYPLKGKIPLPPEVVEIPMNTNKPTVNTNKPTVNTDKPKVYAREFKTTFTGTSTTTDKAANAVYTLMDIKLRMKARQSDCDPSTIKITVSATGVNDRAEATASGSIMCI